MASKRDLVEAHSFNRSRLVTAFLSGAPGGREVEPARYGRMLVGGVVLAGLLLAGAAVSGKLSQPVDKNWLDPGVMVVGKESGSRFLPGDKGNVGTLFPVLNTASARLAYAKPDGTPLKVIYVPDEEIAKRPVGLTLGIPDAPDVLPGESKLIDTGWTACTNEQRGLTVRLAEKPGAEAATNRAILVRGGADDAQFVIAGSHRYPVPKGDDGVNVLRSFQLDGTPAYPVSSAWLDLVTPGSPLKPFRIPGFGAPVDDPQGKLQKAGTPVLVDGRGYVLVDEGVLPLSDFAYALYKNAAEARNLPEVQLSAGDLAGIDTISSLSERPYPADWPSENVTAFNGSAPCLLLRAGQDPEDTARAVLARPTNDAALATRNEVVTDVQTGHGALVRATTTGSATDATPLYLLDSLGTRYAVGSSADPQSQDYRPTTRSALGYHDVDPQAVPQAWVAPFEDGPALLRTLGGKAATP
ncbi:type VII secretion protein EccB [Aeromicrobium sp. NPDC092404]|uniref:type VII secretion protein EccB n=1 Tax=Aeromicrobium sp. NPDC092404 TaxID=3154976 RepID=UPI0034149684